MPITDKKQTDMYYQALLDRSTEFLGTFLVGVKTTSIFCLSTCRARKPKRENVEFFSTMKEALQHGYRPCKVCRPNEELPDSPAAVVKAMGLIKDRPKEKITDADLRSAGIQPEWIRRWFKSKYGITFQAYQRMFRINTAYQELTQGNSTTTAAYRSGYESLSGFGYTFKKVMGTAPSQSTPSIILMSRLNTPLGPMFVCATEEGLCLLEFVDRKMLETEFEDLQKRLKAQILVGENAHIHQTKAELAEYFKGERKTFDIPLHTPGTDFQQKVWSALQAIPFGATASYQEQADRLESSAAVRAVARANGMNRVAIVIPCHRVIGKNGDLTGYAGGLERKRWLLQHEGALEKELFP